MLCWQLMVQIKGS